MSIFAVSFLSLKLHIGYVLNYKFNQLMPYDLPERGKYKYLINTFEKSTAHSILSV